MKKVIALLIIISIVFSASTSFAGNPLKKLGRGAANIITSPYEVIYRIGEVNKESGPVAAVTWGVLNGAYRFALRAVVGVYEVITFPLPILPNDYEPIIKDPEFFLEEGLI